MGRSKNAPMGARGFGRWTGRWVFTEVSKKLGSGHKGPRDITNGARGKDSVCTDAHVDRAKTGGPSIQPRRVAGVGSRSPKTDRETGNRNGGKCRTRVLRTPVPASKEGRVDETSVQSKTTKCVRDLSALQDGGHGNGDEHDRTGRLVLQDRPEGRLLCNTDSPRSPQVPALHLERSGLPVQSAPVWAGVRASDFHKITETSHSTAAASGSQDGPIPGRLHVNEPELRRSKERQGHHAVCLDEVGFHHKLAQVGAGLDPHPGVPGLACQLSGYDAGASTEQGSGYQGTLHRDDALTYRDGKAVSQAGRKINSNSFGSSPRAIVLQGTADAEDQRLAEKPTELRSLGDTDTRVQGGANVVGRVARAPQWPIFHRDLPGPSDHNRRVEDRLGSSDGGSENTGCMVGRGVTTTHQRPRTESSEVCCDGIHETQIPQPCSPMHGQCNGSSLCEQEGGDTIIVGPTRNERDMAILPCQEDHSYSRASARQIEYGGGFPIPLPAGQQLLEAGPTTVQDAESAVGPTTYRSVCRPSDDTATNICELETGPGSPNDGCLLMRVAGQDDVCLSTILPDQQMPGEAGQRPRGDGINHTHMAHTGMVPTVADQTVRHPDIVTTIRPTTDLPGRRSASISEDGTVTAGGLEDQWQEGPDRALSEDTAAMLLRSRRDGTRKAYQHPSEEWTRWCDERQADPVQAPVEMIANFLTERFKQSGLEYRTLNVYRSAISAYHEPLLGQPVGQHQVITRLLKGMFNSRPPQPKYTDTWDVQLVLDRLRRLPDNAQLDLKELSLKVVMLLLTTASRVSELHKLNMSNMCDKGEVVEFHIGDLTKTRKVGDGPLLIQLTQYDKESKLDVVSCLRQYIKETGQVRKPGTEGEQLLISFRPPHAPIAPSSVARWLKMGLQEAGIDIQKYQAHSTRAAATSKAAGQVIIIVDC